jgi:quinohemoprotein amine dehydrogenase
MPNVHRWLAAGILVLPVMLAAAPQQPQQAPSSPQKPRETALEEGLPVSDPEVRKACGACHTSDEKSRMTRISFRRATPENWELTIRRMMSLNNVELTPEAARRIIKYLSDHHGLAPEEARPAMFDAERRLIDYTYEADADVNRLCSTCHSMGRVISERRSRQEWVELLAMHRYYYPLIDGGSGGFRRGGGGGGRGAATAAGASGAAARGRGNGQPQRGRGGDEGGDGNNRQPFERAQDHLADVFPLTSPEWAAWSAARRTPRLAGRWALAGYEIGKGPVYGQVTITERPDAPDGFLTDGRFVYARTGQTVTRRSRAVVYTGFQWRGRSADTPDDPGTWREVAFVERNGQEIKGRWFSGAHDEIGIDVTLRRVANDPAVMGTDVSALKTSSSAQRVRIFGANLPGKIGPAEIDFGQGVRVSRVVASAADVLTVEVDVAADARIGLRDLSVAGFTKSSALVVYARIDGIKVLPQAGMARLGGAAFPARLEQFEARGVSNGPDGKPGGGDDLDLGPIDARWSLEEYTATFKDDDVQFVGELNQSGLFMPNIDGPNPKRSGNRNNVGDVWVVATHTPPGADASARPLRARAHLLVTVPIYIDWAPKEVGR